MSKSVFVIDTPKDCLHCEMRRVIYDSSTKKHYQQCGFNHDGCGLESWFKENDLKNGWVSPKCPLVGEEEFKERNTRELIKRIVERLEEMKMRYFLTIGNSGSANLDSVYEEVGNCIDRAIEIVKEEGGL